MPGLRIVVTEVNGQPGILGIADGRLLAALVLDVVGGRVAAVRTIVNPDKLTFLAAQLL